MTARFVIDDPVPGHATHVAERARTDARLEPPRPPAHHDEPRSLRRDINNVRQREGRLIFYLADAHRPPPPLVAPDARTDWRKLLQIAWEEGAVAPLQAYCRAIPAGVVPIDVERQLACLVLERELRMRMLERRAAESVAVLNEAGIEVALLKGAALAVTLYGSFDARPMNDVDILVHPARADDAKRLMLLSGWSPDPELPNDAVYDAHHHHLAPLVDARGSRSRLEIHRMLLPKGHPFNLTVEELWRGMPGARLAGEPVRVLDANHHAVHVAVHFAWSHTMRAGAWHAFRDLTNLVRAGRIDWTELVAIAERARATSCCYWTLKLARAMSGLAVPDTVLDVLAPSMSRLVLRRLERHFVHVLLRDDEAHRSLRLERALWTMALQPAQGGHGRTRPWLVSAELTAARLGQKAPPAVDRLQRHIDRVVRCSAYMVNILWH
jgi:hypothetical protein